MTTSGGSAVRQPVLPGLAALSVDAGPAVAWMSGVPAEVPAAGVRVELSDDVEGGWFGSAVFSADGRFRYALGRLWGDRSASVADVAVWVMLNPSTATERVLDPTLRRCASFSRAWGCAGMVVMNLFAFRATSPAVMKAQPDPVGPLNDVLLAALAARAGRVVAAWGTHGAFRGRADEVVALLAPVPLWRVGGLSKAGFPRHPLYLPASAPVVRFR